MVKLYSCSLLTKHTLQSQLGSVSIPDYLIMYVTYSKLYLEHNEAMNDEDDANHHLNIGKNDEEIKRITPSHDNLTPLLRPTRNPATPRHTVHALTSSHSQPPPSVFRFDTKKIIFLVWHLCFPDANEAVPLVSLPYTLTTVVVTRNTSTLATYLSTVLCPTPCMQDALGTLVSIHNKYNQQRRTQPILSFK